MKRHKVWYYMYHKCLTPNFGCYHPDYEAIRIKSRAKKTKEEAKKAALKRFGENELINVVIYSEWKYK